MGYEADHHIGRLAIKRVEVIDSDDSQPEQFSTVKGLSGEIIKRAYRAQAFGETGHVPAGSTGLALTVGGRDSKTVLIGLEHKDHRVTGLGQGERCLYNQFGEKIYQYQAKTRIETQELEIIGNVTIVGDITMTGNFNQSGVHIDSNGPHTA